MRYANLALQRLQSGQRIIIKYHIPYKGQEATTPNGFCPLVQCDARLPSCRQGTSFVLRRLDFTKKRV